MDKNEKALADLAESLEGKSKKEIEAQIKAFKEDYDKEVEEKVKDLVGEEVKTVKEQMEKERNEKLEAMQKHLDKLDVKSQAPAIHSKKEQGFDQKLAKFIGDNGDKIKGMRGKEVFTPELIKAVGNMTTANLTGDEERAYSRDVIGIPGRLIHFIDLVGPDINIGVGTYTYPTEQAGEGAIATQTEGSDKAQVDSDYTNVDVTTDFLAGFAVYSKKMRNNLPFLQSHLPVSLRRKYLNAEDGVFNTVLAAAATASSQSITSSSKIAMIYAEIAALAAINVAPNVIAMTPADYFDILQFEKSTGAGYGLPLGVTVSDEGVVRILGVQVVWVNWLAANKYYVGDFMEINRVVTEGLSLEFSEHDEDNFRKNNITARIEAQIGLAVHRPTSVIYGDFTATLWLVWFF